jgi:hypothetical protein
LGWYVKDLRIYCDRTWPNEQWDGFRIAIFGYDGEVPGEIIWPVNGDPQWVKPDLVYAAGWCDFSVEWYPISDVFIAAREQFYDVPDCDAAAFDAASWQVEHTWFRGPDDWVKTNDATLMLRVLAELRGDVEPASLGRVKALYR